MFPISMYQDVIDDAVCNVGLHATLMGNYAWKVIKMLTFFNNDIYKTAIDATTKIVALTAEGDVNVASLEDVATAASQCHISIINLVDMVGDNVVALAAKNVASEYYQTDANVRHVSRLIERAKSNADAVHQLEQEISVLDAEISRFFWEPRNRQNLLLKNQKRHQRIQLAAQLPAPILCDIVVEQKLQQCLPKYYSSTVVPILRWWYSKWLRVMNQSSDIPLFLSELEKLISAPSPQLLLSLRTKLVEFSAILNWGCYPWQPLAQKMLTDVCIMEASL